MKGLTRVLIALTGLAIALLGLATPATAAPYSNPLTVGTNAQSYVAASPAVISGTDGTPGRTVTLSILGESIVLGSPTADASGNYRIDVTFPSGLCGPQTVVAHDITTGRTATTDITINCTTAQGGLSATGVAVASLGALAVVLVIGGALLLLAGRRRRTTD